MKSVFDELEGVVRVAFDWDPASFRPRATACVGGQRHVVVAAEEDIEMEGDGLRLKFSFWSKMRQDPVFQGASAIVLDLPNRFVLDGDGSLIERLCTMGEESSDGETWAPTSGLTEFCNFDEAIAPYFLAPQDKIVAEPPVARDYLRHDPTKNVSRRRRR